MRTIQNFIDIKSIDKPTVENILQQSENFQRGTRTVPLFFEKKPIVSSFFLENSTRTRLSFEVAALKLGCNFIHFEANASSMNKGESLLDSLKCLDAMGVSACVVRWTEENLLKEFSEKLKMKLICAGEGTSSHPSQAMLDYYTLKKYWNDFSGKKLLIVGDLSHSRVFHSHLEMAEKMGVQLSVSGPKEWIPASIMDKYVDFDNALETVDAVMMLRVQTERHKDAKAKTNYNFEFGLNQDRLNRLSQEALILHPGPFNLGVEIESCVLDDPRCKIFEQVENSIFVRMAIMEQVLGVSNES